MGCKVRRRRVRWTSVILFQSVADVGKCVKSVFTFQPPKKGRRRLVVPIACKPVWRFRTATVHSREKRHTLTESLRQCQSFGFSLLSPELYVQDCECCHYSFGVSRLEWFRKYTNAPQKTENNKKMSRKVSIVLGDNARVLLNQFYAMDAVSSC